MFVAWNIQHRMFLSLSSKVLSNILQTFVIDQIRTIVIIKYDSITMLSLLILNVFRNLNFTIFVPLPRSQSSNFVQIRLSAIRMLPRSVEKCESERVMIIGVKPKKTHTLCNENPKFFASPLDIRRRLTILADTVLGVSLGRTIG